MGMADIRFQGRAVDATPRILIVNFIKKTMGTIKINLKEQCLWYGWYRILSLRFPEASRQWVVNEVNKIVYKK